ncbi:hypothetical protein EEAAV_26870 (plasmid) [Rahnella aceris]
MFQSIMLVIVVCTVIVLHYLTEITLNFILKQQGGSVGSTITSQQWLRVGLGFFLLLIVMVFPPVFLAFTMKLAALINICIQCWRLKSAYVPQSENSLLAWMSRAVKKRKVK